MRKICVFTGTRADYGLLKPLMVRIKNDESLLLQIIASGMHLSNEFGLTFSEIENDGFKIDEKIEMLLSSDTSNATVKSTAIGMIGFVDALERLSPDIVVLLGDRFETLSFAYSAFIKSIPVVHFSGGEVTEGAIDDSIRHAITKFSHIHFVATREYKKRVIQLGENPKNVFVVGEIGLIGMKDNLLSKEELEDSIGFKLNKKNILVTYNPETLNLEQTKKDFENILNILEELNDTNIIFTKANADANGRIINQMIDKFVKNHKNSIAFTSLGRKRYLSALQYVDMVLGNSSSGLVEAPSFKIATVNIGNRQKGRLKADSVIDVNARKGNILKAIKYVYSEDFQKRLKFVKNPYEKEDSLNYIINILKNTNLKKILKKSFYDIKC